MLRIIREGQRWLIWLIVIGVGGVFVFFLGLGGAPGGGPTLGSVAKVGDLEIDAGSFERVREQRQQLLEQQLGDQFDARRFSDTLDGMAMRDLVDQALLVLAARDLGLTVSKAEIEQTVLAEGAFRDEGGRFDEEGFRDFVQYNFGSEANFMEEQGHRLLGLKVLRLLTQQPHVSDGEARAILERELDRVRLAYVTLDTSVDPAASVPPERLEEALASRASELESLYEAERSRYEKPEQVRARHILVRADAGADEAALAEAEARAGALRERIEAGEAFADVAREASDDAASRQAGGDLGFFQRGQMVPEFEEAAFAATQGELVGPVRSNFGFHLIRVDERREAVSQALEDVREELARELVLQDLAVEAAQARADALAAAVEGGASLEDAARGEGLALERTDWVARRADGFVPGLGAAPELMAAAFSLEAGASSPRIFEVGEKLALLQVLERQAADPAVVAERLEETRERLLLDRRNRRADTWVGAKRDALLDEGQLIVDLESYRQR